MSVPAEPTTRPRRVVSVGNFDGVHRGHRRILAVLRELASELAAPAVAVTFDPHPAAVLRPTQSVTALTTIERRIDLLRAAGADEVVVLQPTLDLLRLTPAEFFTQVLVERLGVVGMVEGENFCFGKDRTGDIHVLKELARPRRVRVLVAPMTEGAAAVSSTRVRQALQAGAVTEAWQLLGRPHGIVGTVVGGAGRGRTIGVPTANLAPAGGLAPAEGVYAVRVQVGDRWHAGACHRGPNVTFGADAVTLETHLLDFDGSLLGQTILIEFLQRVRSTMKFADAPTLIDQIHRDIASCREIAAPHVPPPPLDDLHVAITEWLSHHYPASTATLANLDLSDDGVLAMPSLRSDPKTPVEQFDDVLFLSARLRRVFPDLKAVRIVD